MPLELVSDEPWSTIWRTPDGLWRKRCKGAWRFEAPLTAALASRWPDRVAEVVEHGDDWLLTRDAGSQIAEDDPLWPEAVRLYAELQQGEAVHVEEHVACGVPDLRLAQLVLMTESDLPGLEDQLGHTLGVATDQLLWDHVDSVGWAHEGGNRSLAVLPAVAGLM